MSLREIIVGDAFLLVTVETVDMVELKVLGTCVPAANVVVVVCFVIAVLRFRRD